LGVASLEQVETEEGRAGVAAPVKEPAETLASVPPPPEPASPGRAYAEPASVAVPKREVREDKLDDAKMGRAKGQRQLARTALNRPAFREKAGETTAVSESELEAECLALRNSLSQESDQAADLWYRLAKCSIRLFRQRGAEEDLRQAEEDASRFLQLFPEDDRAEEVRGLLDQLKSNQ
jgi:hypothetical protein